MVSLLAWLGELHTPTQSHRVVISVSCFSFTPGSVLSGRTDILPCCQGFRLFTYLNFSPPCGGNVIRTNSMGWIPFHLKNYLKFTCCPKVVRRYGNCWIVWEWLQVAAKWSAVNHIRGPNGTNYTLVFFLALSSRNNTNTEFSVSLIVHCFLPHCVKCNTRGLESFYTWGWSPDCSWHVPLG